jgi:hypothetical protein
LDLYQFASLRLASASVVALEVVAVWSKCCVRRGLFGLFRGAHMLKTVAICSNLLVLILLSVWVVGSIDFDVNYIHIGSV